jgi:hypothetical protein
MTFELARSINTSLKRLADDIELKRETPIIVTKKIILNTLNSLPQEFSYIAVAYGYPVSAKYVRYKSSNFYKLCISKNCKFEFCTCSNHILGLNSESIDYRLYQLSQLNIEHFIPDYNFIKAAVLSHPLAKNNNSDEIQSFVCKKLKLTVRYYFKIIKRINLVIKSHKSLEQAFFENICRQLNINYKDHQDVLTLIFNRINN